MSNIKNKNKNCIHFDYKIIVQFLILMYFIKKLTSYSYKKKIMNNMYFYFFFS